MHNYKKKKQYKKSQNKYNGLENMLGWQITEGNECQVQNADKVLRVH